MTTFRRIVRDERGSAIVDFVIVTVVLVPLFLGILQLALVLHVRNTLTSAASEGARYAATSDRGPADGAAKTREQIRGALAASYADDVVAQPIDLGGAPGVEVVVRAEVPALGLAGMAVEIEVRGTAVEELAE
jgi:Flp pilus assembly protein TadG